MPLNHLNPMQINASADRPLYKQLADLIRTQINSGELIPGQRIPSQKDYVQEHGLSRDTVDRAMIVLRNEGLIDINRRGARVRCPPDSTVVYVAADCTITARTPTEPERKRLGTNEGVPLIVVDHPDHDPKTYPADRVRLKFAPKVTT